MKMLHKIFEFLKPLIIVLAIMGILQMFGQLGNVVSVSRAAVLKTGILNAGDKAEAETPFNFNFDATTVDGQPIDINTLKNKVVFLNLWATWCGPCRAEMPTIQKLYDDTKNPNIVFVILSLDRGAAADKKVRDYILKSKYTFPVYVLRSQVEGQLAVPSIPTTYIISKKGNIVKTEIGMTNYHTDRFKKFLGKLSAE